MRKEEWYMGNISLEDAKKLVSQESLSKLQKLVTPEPIINMESKVNNDIIMAALCAAVSNGVIRQQSLDDRLVKLLNSSTNTLSAVKLGPILSSIRMVQPNMKCVIELKKADMSDVIERWVFIGPIVKFNKIFEYVIDKFNITPTLIRTKMTEMLKPTIVNNVAQLVAKYTNLETDEERADVPISISTITRLVNMSGYLLMAEFTDRGD